MRVESKQMFNHPILGIVSGFGSGLAWLAGWLGLISPIIAFTATLGGAILVWIHVYRALKGKDK